jgi:hypothetical protein
VECAYQNEPPHPEGTCDTERVCRELLEAHRRCPKPRK